jgi:rhodanese-related sulfurtransferase
MTQVGEASPVARPTKGKIMFSEATSVSSDPAPVHEITVTELAERVQSSQPPVVAEILGPNHFASGHLPGAINLPLEGFSEAAQRALPIQSADIVVYCASTTCKNSDIAARKLLALGYGNVRVFRGGKAAWREAGLPLVGA